MRTHYRAVNEQCFQIPVFTDGFDHTLPDTALAPAREPRIRGVPVPQCRVQIAPRAAGARNPQNRFDKQAIVFALHPGVADFAG